MNIYKEWGFYESPFNTSALQSNENGMSLLVGRDTEIGQILRRLFTPTASVTIEGLNGVGKTSLVNVSLFKAYQNFFDEETTSLFIPCGKTFQITAETTVDEFVSNLYLEIAQTLIRRSEELKNLGFNLPSNSISIDKWLNSTHVTTWQATLGPMGGGKNIETNTTNGFTESGFKVQIDNWLKEIFPNEENGAVVCIIDNLELLETSEQAKRQLERLRDEIFNLTGIRWVMCGSLGIVKSVASTPRLEGYLHNPIEISSVKRQFIKNLFEKRIKYFSTDTNQTGYLPLTIDDIDFLYEVLNENLRNTIHYCDQYCLYFVDKGITAKTNSDKSKFFLIWLQGEADSIMSSVEGQLRPRALKLFNDIITHGGIFSPSDFEKFEFNSVAALRPQVLELERVALLSSTIDESDNRRKTIQVTPKGWLTSFALRQKK
jgi:hypothetical protein